MGVPASPWPSRLAWLTFASTLVLVCAGGSVTTYRVGMAVPDWPATFGHNMVLFPLEEMLQSFGVTLEHSHRLLGAWVGTCAFAFTATTLWLAGRRVGAGLALIAFLAMGAQGPIHPSTGLLAIGALVLALFTSGRRATELLPVGAFLAVCVQGWLGGARVLENSQDLAFLHGSLAQLVVALIAAATIVQARAWRAQEARPCKRAPGLHRLGLAALIVVYGQIVLGAWLRHSGATLPLLLHVTGALVAVGLPLMLARSLRRAAAEGEAGGHDRSVLLRQRTRLIAVVVAQFLLGIGALVAVLLASGGFDRPVSQAEAWLATGHVLGGALLLAQTLVSWLWSRRVVLDPRAVAPTASESAPNGAPREAHA